MSYVCVIFICEQINTSKHAFVIKDAMTDVSNKIFWLTYVGE